MPSDPSNFNQENPLSEENLIEPSTTFQHGNPLENDTNPEISLEQRQFREGAPEESENFRDIKVCTTSTESNNNGEPDRPGQVNDDAGGKSHAQESYRKFCGIPIRSTSESALERRLEVLALSKCSAIERLPNGNRLDSEGLYDIDLYVRSFKSHILTLSSIVSCR